MKKLSITKGLQPASITRQGEKAFVTIGMSFICEAFEHNDTFKNNAEFHKIVSKDDDKANIANQCGLTPSELLVQNFKLKSALQNILSNILINLEYGHALTIDEMKAAKSVINRALAHDALTQEESPSVPAMDLNQENFENLGQQAVNFFDGVSNEKAPLPKDYKAFTEKEGNI